MLDQKTYQKVFNHLPEREQKQLFPTYLTHGNRFQYLSERSRVEQLLGYIEAKPTFTKTDADTRRHLQYYKKQLDLIILEVK